MAAEKTKKGEIDAIETLRSMLVSFAFATAGVFAFFLIIKILQATQ